MKNSGKLTASLVLTIGAIIATSKLAAAGEGRAAAAVAVYLNENNIITGISTSIAVGKNDANATALVDGGNTFTSAVGSAGVIILTDPDRPNASYKVGTDPDLKTPQTKTLSNSGSLSATTPGASTLITPAIP